MKKILFKMMLLSCIVLTAFTSMAQGSFAYQAVIRDSKGQLVCDKTVGMRFTLSYDSKDYYQETQTPTTNAYGNVSVMIGSGKVASGSFMSVPWNTMQIMMKVEVSVDNNSDYISLGDVQIQSVPYAMYAASFNTELQAADGAAEDVPLFSVKNSDGELVFAVYPSGVKVYVDDDESKAMRSSFAVSKRHSAAKDGAEEEIFSVGNFGTTVYVDDDESKAMRSSFAVSGRHSAVKDGETNNYLSVNAEGTTVYVDDDENKAMRSSFAVSGRHSAVKDGETNDYLSVNAEGTQVYVDDDESKAMRSSFAVSGRHSATKDGNSDDLFSVSGSDVNIAASSFNVSDKESEKVVFAVNNSKVNVKSDILMTGGIGNVDEEVAQADDILELDDIIEVRADDAYHGYYGLNDESSVLVKNGVTSISDVTLYGIDENGSLIKAKADGSNYLQCLYYDKSGTSVWKETDYNVMLDDQQISLKVPAKAVATAKFCVVAKYYDYVGDDEVEKSVRVDFTLKSDDVDPISETRQRCYMSYDLITVENGESSKIDEEYYYYPFDDDNYGVSAYEYTRSITLISENDYLFIYNVYVNYNNNLYVLNNTYTTTDKDAKPNNDTWKCSSVINDCGSEPYRSFKYYEKIAEVGDLTLTQQPDDPNNGQYEYTDKSGEVKVKIVTKNGFVVVFDHQKEDMGSFSVGSDKMSFGDYVWDDSIFDAEGLAKLIDALVTE